MGDIDFGLLAIWYFVFVLSTTFHEFAHAFLAYKGGDLTAYEGGVLSLDPLPHMRRSPGGMVIIPLLSFVFSGFMIGWASVPYDPQWGRRNPTKHALMSLAGPLTNLLLALIAFIAIRALLSAGVFVIPDSPSISQLVTIPNAGDARTPLAALSTTLSILLNLNVLLGLFNLFPVPPLDGAGVAEGASPKTLGGLYEKMREIPMIELLGLLIAWRFFGYVASPALTTVARLLYRSF